MFQRGSRASLASFSEEDPKKPRSNEQHVHPKTEAQQLDELFEILTSPAHSNRYEDQRSPPPPSPPPEEVEGLATDVDVDNDLDDIFDLATTINSDRIDDQRSTALLPPVQQSGATSPEKTKKKKKIPKYFLPTGSPFLQRKAGLRSVSPTNFSMPDLSSDDNVPTTTHNSKLYVTHSTSNTPNHSRARLASDISHSNTPYHRGPPRTRLTSDNSHLNHCNPNRHRGYVHNSALNGTCVEEGDLERRSSFSSSYSHSLVGRGETYPLVHSNYRAQVYSTGPNCATDPVARRPLPVQGRSYDQTIVSGLAVSEPSVSHAPPTSPLAMTAYSRSYQSYTESEGSPFVSRQHTQSNSTTNTASMNNSSSSVSHQHSQSTSIAAAYTANQNDEVADTSLMF